MTNPFIYRKLSVLFLLFITFGNVYSKNKEMEQLFSRLDSVLTNSEKYVLEKEDKNRFNSRYKYIIDILKVLVAEKISDNNNEKEYERYKQKNIENVYLLYDIIQNPENEKQISKIEEVIFSRTEDFTDMSSYYYTKLYEFWNNEDMEEILLEHFKNRINPFNKNITNIRELYCLVKAYNYYKNEDKAEN